MGLRGRTLRSTTSLVRPSHFWTIWPKSLAGASPRTGFGRFGNCHLGRPSRTIILCNLSTSLFAQFDHFGRFLKIALDRPLLRKVIFSNMFLFNSLKLQNVSKSVWIDLCWLKWAPEEQDIVTKPIHRSEHVPDQIALDRPLSLQITLGYVHILDEIAWPTKLLWIDPCRQKYGFRTPCSFGESFGSRSVKLTF